MKKRKKKNSTKKEKKENNENEKNNKITKTIAKRVITKKASTKICEFAYKTAIKKTIEKKLLAFIKKMY